MQAEKLSCWRGGRLLFGGLDFTVRSGESLVLQGPNGAGKSSLLRLLAGLLPRRSGTLTLRGGVALADERLALDPTLPLEQALHFWAAMDGSADSRLERAMAAMALGELTEVPVRMLSTGQRKRAILARTLASRAAIWLLDEPGNGLDTASLGALNRAMDQHVADGGILIAATHFAFAHAFTHELRLGTGVRDDVDADEDDEDDA